MYEDALTHTERFDAVCAIRRDRRLLTFGGKKTSDGTRGKREKKRGTASAEFENRVNGASYGAYTVVSAHVKIGARTVAAHAAELVHSRHSRELES